MTQLPSKVPEKEIPWKRGCLQHWPITTAINNLTDQSEFKVNTRFGWARKVIKAGEGFAALRARLCGFATPQCVRQNRHATQATIRVAGVSSAGKRIKKVTEFRLCSWLVEKTSSTLLARGKWTPPRRHDARSEGQHFFARGDFLRPRVYSLPEINSRNYAFL